MIKPKVSDKLDYEAELEVVIGKADRHIPADRAFEHVAGHAPYNDGSVRYWQRHTTQCTPGKNFVTTSVFGPWMPPPADAAAPAHVTVAQRLPGQRQRIA